MSSEHTMILNRTCTIFVKLIHSKLSSFFFGIFHYKFIGHTSAAGFLFIYIAHVVIVPPMVRFEDFVLLFAIGT